MSLTGILQEKGDKKIIVDGKGYLVTTKDVRERLSRKEIGNEITFVVNDCREVIGVLDKAPEVQEAKTPLCAIQKEEPVVPPETPVQKKPLADIIKSTMSMEKQESKVPDLPPEMLKQVTEYFYRLMLQGPNGGLPDDMDVPNKPSFTVPVQISQNERRIGLQSNLNTAQPLVSLAYQIYFQHYPLNVSLGELEALMERDTKRMAYGFDLWISQMTGIA